MTPHFISCVWLFTGQARRWFHRHCTAAGRQAMRRRQRELELRRAGVPRNVAVLAASRMVDPSRRQRAKLRDGSPEVLTKQ